MKKLVFILLLLSFSVNAQNLTIDCGIKIEKGSTVVLDTLNQVCYKTLLLQDNSVLEVKYISQLDSIKFKYGDTGGDTLDNVDYDIIRRVTINGVEYVDKRPVGDVNPKVILHNYRGENVFFTDLIDVEYIDDYSLATSDEGIPEVDLQKMQCTIYNFIGQTIYEGKFGDLFEGTKIDCKYSSILLLIRFYNDAGGFASKRYYTDFYGTGGCD